MYKEAVLTGSNSLGPFIWVTQVFWSVSALDDASLMLDETLLQFLIDKMDCQLPPCLQVL